MYFLQIQVHGSDWTSFYEQVPKKILPNEYGGEAGSVADHWGKIFKFSLRVLNLHNCTTGERLILLSNYSIFFTIVQFALSNRHT